MIKKYVIEAIGTAVLTLIVGMAMAGVVSIPVPVLAALTLGLFVYTVGHVSGVHFNPAVTLGVWSLQKISNRDTVRYIIAQFVGAGGALLLMPFLVDTTTALQTSDSFRVGIAELIGTVLFTFGVSAVVFNKEPVVAQGAVVGGSLLLGIVLAVLAGGNGILNPAVALGIGSFTIMSVLGPIVGSVLGMQLYQWLASDR